MPHANAQYHLLVFSPVSWIIAIVCWTNATSLDTTSSVGVVNSTVLFAMGLAAAVAAIAAFLMADCGSAREPMLATRAGGAAVAGSARGDGVRPRV